MVKQVKKGVTRAEVEAIIAGISPQFSSSELDKRRKADARIFKSQAAIATKRARRKLKNTSRGRNTAAGSRRALDKKAGITTDRDGKKVYPKAGPGTTPKTDEYKAQAKRAEIDQVEQTGEQPKKKDPSLFEKTVDILLRGNYASANAFKEGFDPKTPEKYEFQEAVKGFKRGLAGKDKTVFKDVLKQHDYTGRGMGTLGFALDIAADPTTYMGFGLIGKAARGGKAAREGLEKTVELVDEVAAKAPNFSKEAVTKAVGADRIAVKEIGLRQKSKLSPQARALYDSVKATQKATGTYKNGTRVGLGEYKALNRTVKGSARQTVVKVDDIADPILKNSVDKAVKKELQDVPGLNEVIKSVAKATEVVEFGGLSSKLMKTIKIGKVFDSTAATQKWLDEGVPAGWTSVPVKTPAELASYVAVHEVGHHAGYALTEQQKEKIMNVVVDLAPKVLSADGKRAWIKENLSDYAIQPGKDGEWNREEFFAEAWAEFRIKGANARPLAKAVGKIMQANVIKKSPDKTSSKLLEAISSDVAEEARLKVKIALDREIATKTDDVVRRRIVDELEDEMTRGKKMDFGEYDAELGKRLKAAGLDMTAKGLRGKAYDDELAKRIAAEGIDDIAGKLIAQTTENLAPKVKKQLALRVGGARFAIPGVAAVVKGGADLVGKPEFVRKSVGAFNTAFRANAYIPESLRYLRSREVSIGANLVREYGREIASVWDVVPGEVRRSIAKAWGRDELQAIKQAGGLSRVNNAPVDNVMKYLDGEMMGLQATIQRQGLSAAELNAQLPKSLSIVETKTTKTVKEAVDNGNGVISSKSTSTTEFDADSFLQSAKTHMRNGHITDPAVALYSYTIAVNQAIAKREIWNEIGRTHGVKASLTNVADALAKEGWVKATINDAPIRGLEETLFDPEIAEAIGRMAEVFGTAKSTGKFLNGYDRSLLGVKAILTKYNPSFHPRTFMGEIILGYLGGMKNLPVSYNQAFKVIHGRNSEFMGPGFESGATAKKSVVQTSNVILGSREAAPQTDKKAVINTRWGKLNADSIWHHYMYSGLKSGFASTDMVRGVEETLGGKRLRDFGDATQRGTEAIEDVGRLAHFIDALKYSKAPTLEQGIEEASMAVRKAHLDYTEVTGFEKSVMARIMPFYKWLRLSTPLMAEILLTQPGKAIAIPKAMDFATRAAGYDPQNVGALPGGPDAAVPEWLLDAGARPIGNLGTENSQWLNPQSLVPFAGSLGLAGEAMNEGEEGNPVAAPFRAASDIVNPLIAAPFELGLDAQNKGAAPSSDYGKYAMSQTPQTGFLRKMLSDEDPDVSNTELILKFLANPGLFANTERSIEGAALQEQQEAYRQRREAKRRAGLLEPKK